MLHGNERGQGMVEYGMISGLLAVVVVSSFVALGPQLNEAFQQSSNSAASPDGSVPMQSVEDGDYVAPDDGSTTDDGNTLDDGTTTDDCDSTSDGTLDTQECDDTTQTLNG